MAMTTFVQAINQALVEEMERDPLTFLMGEDVVLSIFGATKGLMDKFGDKRVRNTPISEAGFVGAAVGAAMAGTRPICEVEFASFFYCAFDQPYLRPHLLLTLSGAGRPTNFLLRKRRGISSTTASTPRAGSSGPLACRNF